MPTFFKTSKILAVDDNCANRQLLQEFLQDYGANVTAASSGPNAVKLCREDSFDLIFMDIEMPDMDGSQATYLIRINEPSAQRTPIVALTAHDIENRKTELLLAGFDDCATKPINKTQLEQILTRWLAQSTSTENASPLATSAPRKQLPIMNRQEALRLTNGKAPLAKDMLSMLIESLPNWARNIEQFSRDKDWKELWNSVHKLHGGCCYCGTTELLDASAELDQLLKDGLTDNLSKSIENTLVAINRLLDWAEEYDLDVIFELTDA